jgi:hypothetical protein
MFQNFILLYYIMSKQAKAKLIAYYENELKKMLSDSDFKRYFGEGKVIKYSELDNYSTINDLLPAEKCLSSSPMLNKCILS